MYIRCGKCLATSWLDSLTPGESSLTDACKTCSATFNLMGALELGSTEEEQQSKAHQFAEYNDYDLPSAYSILLGLLTPEQARELREQRRADEAELEKKEEQREAAKAARKAEAEIEIEIVDDETEAPIANSADKSAGQRLPYDAAFKPAVDEGFLTPMQASERGKRSAWAARIARRHSLSMSVAERVADNRSTLHEAVRKKSKPVGTVSAPARSNKQAPTKRWQNALALVAALAVLVAIGLQARARWISTVEEGRAVTKRAREATEVAERKQALAASNAAATNDESNAPEAAPQVRADKNGRLMKITAANPNAVLEAFCNSSPMAFRDPVAIVEAEPPVAGTRRGVYREATEYYSITIKRNENTRGWSTGTGRQWIRPKLHPNVPDAARASR